MLCSALVLGLLCPTLTPATFDDELPAPMAEAFSELFAKNCVACHQPPDARFAVDRAWITQLADTA